MQSINFNVFHYNTFAGSYPYTLEDVGTTFVMYLNNIKFTDNQNMFTEPRNKSDQAIAIHTNEFK